MSAHIDIGSRLNVVLMRPIYPRNIGMCARAIANMGASRLVLVAPQCELTEDAKQGATKAQKILREATIYPSLSEFYANEGEGVRIALSGRGGKLRTPAPLDQKLLQLDRQRDTLIHDPAGAVYLIFGPEDDGLNDEEIRDVHHVCSLPTYGEFFSMNISHAVMLTLYIVRTYLESQSGSSKRATSPTEMAATAASTTTATEHEDKSPGELLKERLKAARAPKYFPEKTIQSWLEALGFELSDRRVNAARILNRILLENEPSHDELRVLEAIIQQTIRKLKC